MDELKENVQRGAQLLDKECPGWAHAIQLDHLVMSSPFFCTIGQLFGAYTVGLEMLGIGEEDKTKYYEQYYGFEAVGDHPLDYKILYYYWQQEIQARISSLMPLSTGPVSGPVE